MGPEIPGLGSSEKRNLTLTPFQGLGGTSTAPSSGGTVREPPTEAGGPACAPSHLRRHLEVSPPSAKPLGRLITKGFESRRNGLGTKASRRGCPKSREGAPKTHQVGDHSRRGVPKPWGLNDHERWERRWEEVGSRLTFPEVREASPKTPAWRQGTLFCFGPTQSLFPALNCSIRGDNFRRFRRLKRGLQRLRSVMRDRSRGVGFASLGVNFFIIFHPSHTKLDPAPYSLVLRSIL